MEGDTNGFSWHWSPETWAWSPAHGRWSPKYGRPNGCVYLEVSTDGLDPEESYDFWRETVFYDFAANHREGNERDGFRAYARGLVASRAEFFVYRSDAVSGRRTPTQIRTDDGTDVSLGLVLAGNRYHRDDDDMEAASGRGEFFFYDAASPSRVNWGAHDGLHLVLRREAVKAAIGRDVPSARDVVRALATSRLSAFLRAQLVHLAGRIGILSDYERAVILDHTTDLALAVLRDLAFNDPKSVVSYRPGLFAAAQRFIHEHFSDPNLDGVRVAYALGCSRATLYRAFADHELTVAAYIREVRLRHVMRLLTTPTSRAPITAIAARCGFYDLVSFRRAFRTRFGMSPRDARELHHSGR